MAQNEATRKTGEPVVISDTPDVCKTPVGGALVPVPYDIVAYFTGSILTAPTVSFTKDPVFTTASAIPSVIGDEAGTGLGVVSGSHAGGGFCHVLAGSHTPVVKANGNLIVFHTSKMEMNCPSPTGPGNTIGSVVWQSTTPYVSADADGNVDGETDPKEEAETQEELDQKLAQENPQPAQTPEEKYKLKQSEASASSKPVDKQRQWGDAKPSDGVSTSAEANVGVERTVYDDQVWKAGGEDNFIKVGHADAKWNAGYSYDAKEGIHSLGGGGSASVSVAQGQLKGTLPGGLASGTAKGEVLSASANADARVFYDAGNVGAKASVGAEANLIKGSVGGEVVLTVKTMYDSTAGALFGMFDRTKHLAEAPEYLDVGVVVGAEVEAGIGAAASAEAEGSIGTKGAKGSASAKLGAGPQVGVKVTGGIQLPEGAVDKAVSWVKSWF